VVDLFRGTKEDQFQGKARLFGHFFGEPKKKTNRLMETGMGSQGEASWKKDARKDHKPSHAYR
jgi:hypothetical protein